MPIGMQASFLPVRRVLIYDVPCTFVTKKKTKPLEALDTIVHTFALSA